jgi:hypothetical protein
MTTNGRGGRGQLCADSREGVMEGLGRLSAGPRLENEFSSLALVLDLDSELIPEISVVPEEVDDDSAALPVSE